MKFNEIVIILWIAVLGIAEDQFSSITESFNFDSNLFYYVLEEKECENIIISPASVRAGLTLALLGAGGTTFDEMAITLNIFSKNKTILTDVAESELKLLSSSLKFANKIYLNKNFEINAEFNEFSHRGFNTEAENIDLSNGIESSKIINKWVAENTNNKINNIVEPSTVQASNLIIVNAVLFQDSWRHLFNNKFSEIMKFWISLEKSVDVDMMKQTGDFKYAKYDDLNSVAMEMPYTRSNFSMIFILPNERDGLKNLETKLRNVDLIQKTNGMIETKLALRIPKFKIEFNEKLNRVLNSMGTKTMFTPEANFSEMLKNGKIFVSNVLHKAYINVDENGTEASAATVIHSYGLGGGIKPKLPIEFLVDHPFVFFIKDNTRVYFIGHIVKV